jgi:hypothetical protein
MNACDFLSINYMKIRKYKIYIQFAFFEVLDGGENPETKFA